MDEEKLDTDDAEKVKELNMDKLKRRISSIPKRPVVPKEHPFSRGARVGGGKITKNRYRKKGYTRKQKRRSIRSVKKTRKHKRCRKHTRKNVN